MPQVKISDKYLWGNEIISPYMKITMTWKATSQILFLLGQLTHHPPLPPMGREDSNILLPKTRGFRYTGKEYSIFQQCVSHDSLSRWDLIKQDKHIFFFLFLECLPHSGHRKRLWMNEWNSHIWEIRKVVSCYYFHLGSCVVCKWGK